MMRLSTMWNVDRTVDVDGRSPIAERILEHWEHEPGSARFFRSSANFVYTVRREGEDVFLRFADGRERGKDAIAAEVAVLRWLAEAGIDVALPIRSRNGRFVETTETDRGTFHAVLFAGLEGTHLEIEELDDAGFRRWGAALGRLHAALKDVPITAAAARSTWRDHLDRARDVIHPDETAVRRELGQIALSLGALPASPDTSGLIHFDFELDNLVWRGEAVGILDFDDCAHYWYAADIAFALRDLFDCGADLDHRSFREFVGGYAAHAAVDEEMLSQVPLFGRLANLLNYARIARAIDVAGDDTYPEWLTSLRRKLETRIAAYEASLEGREA